MQRRLRMRCRARRRRHERAARTDALWRCVCCVSDAARSTCGASPFNKQSQNSISGAGAGGGGGARSVGGGAMLYCTEEGGAYATSVAMKAE